METKVKDKQEDSNDGNTVLYAVSSDLYRIARKSDGGWEKECVCRACAINVKNDMKSEFDVYYDIHATRSFDPYIDVNFKEKGIDDDFNEELGIEYCTMCGGIIPRGGSNWVAFEVPEGFESC
ncbi:MAG: hypothetical protein ACRDE2_00305 [Chitinophagaceae bacterium]